MLTCDVTVMQQETQQYSNKGTEEEDCKLVSTDVTVYDLTPVAITLKFSQKDYYYY